MRTPPAGIVLLLLLSAAAFLLWGCTSDSQADTVNGEEEDLVVPVEVAEVTSGDITASFSGTATLEAEEETEVVAKVGGVVKDIFVEEGDEVQEGQVLAKLDDEKYAVYLDQLKANLQKLENDFKRSGGLFEKSLISTEEYQRVQYEYESQKAAYNLAKLDLDYTSIQSPIGGVVADRLVKKGNMVLPNAATFRVTGLEPLIAYLHVPEQQMAKLRSGQTALLKVDALEDAEYTGRIERISPVVDPLTGTVKVTVMVRDPSRNLKPGMFARIHIIYDVHAGAVLVPKDALITEDREHSVFVIRENTAYRQIVLPGYVNATHIEILDGVQPGDAVVTTGKGSLKDKTKVERVSGRANQETTTGGI